MAPVIFDHGYSPSGRGISNFLTPHLPTTLPLLRRLQFYHRSPYSHVFATFPVGTQELPRCFVLAYCDRSRASETEMWVLSSLELHDASSDEEKLVLQQLVALLQTARELEFRSENPSADRNTLLMGAVHEKTALPLMNAGLCRGNTIPPTVPYQKYIFHVSDIPQPKPLPKGLIFGKVQSEDFKMILSKTGIPRTPRTLALLPSIAVYSVKYDGAIEKPVAWGFLGPDASTTTLHCEPEYRGQGLAKAVTWRLFTDHLEKYYGREGLGHSDVAEDNPSSQGVCKSLGGQHGWNVYWLKIDMTKVPSAVTAS